MTLGQSLNSYPNLDIFYADSPEELLAILKQIKLPYKIIGYSVSGRRHFALVNLTRPVKKVSQKEIKNI